MIRASLLAFTLLVAIGCPRSDKAEEDSSVGHATPTPVTEPRTGNSSAASPSQERIKGGPFDDGTWDIFKGDVRMGFGLRFQNGTQEFMAIRGPFPFPFEPQGEAIEFRKRAQDAQVAPTDPAEELQGLKNWFGELVQNERINYSELVVTTTGQESCPRESAPLGIGAGTYGVEDAEGNRLGFLLANGGYGFTGESSGQELLYVGEGVDVPFSSSFVLRPFGGGNQLSQRATFSCDTTVPNDSHVEVTSRMSEEFGQPGSALFVKRVQVAFKQHGDNW